MGKNRTSVIVGMSGGVDSSVAALLLKEHGYDVTGLFMKNWDEDDGTEYCTAKQDLEDAQKVCDQLQIKLHTANFSAEYWDNVFEEFLTQYAAGRTPNPDILCNREIKFKQFAKYAIALGSDYIATGHYARGLWENNSFKLLKGSDPLKDQTYFLLAVPSEALQYCLFPLGSLEKNSVRDIARKAGFKNSNKKDSTGICFIGERRFSEFLSRYIPEKTGLIRDVEGLTIGEHVGISYYTIGQRQGLRIGGTQNRPDLPWYVVAKKSADNELVVSQDIQDLNAKWLAAKDLNWLVTPRTTKFSAMAKIRYQQMDQECTVTPRADGTYLVSFLNPQRAISTGQFVCFYEGDLCLGGGLIDSVGGKYDAIF
ncbi:MAG: tRNA 2-thiouridine(34) synthase MnmA [Gammaproteobacteria bacterium]|nr:tRNA 2-thiouridine(34) synthase MnmA [Gammaproteobacteria bacterium]